MSTRTRRGVYTHRFNKPMFAVYRSIYGLYGSYGLWRVVVCGALQTCIAAALLCDAIETGFNDGATDDDDNDYMSVMHMESF